MVIGFALGRLERRTGAGKPRRQRWRELAGTVLAVVAVAAVALTVFQVQSNAETDRARARCDSEFSRAVALSIAERSAANGAAAAEQRALAVASLEGDPERTREALTAFIAALDEQEAARRAAPLPAPPEC